MWEAIALWALLYGKHATDGERLLEQLGLADKRNAWFMTLSGGFKSNGCSLRLRSSTIRRWCFSTN